MRFAHLSDSHLGYRQFGLLERENDFYDVFARNIDKIIEKDVDFIIHSGDLFENVRPSTEALLAFQKALLRLKEEKISIYAIAGNHDSVLRKGALPPQVLFKDLGLKLISPDNPAYVEGAVLICGIPYVASSQKRALISAYNNLSKLADKYLKSILVSHQGIDKWMYKDSHEVELAEMPKNFDYYAMGHIHNYIEEDFGKGKLVYPGSMEIWKTSESNDNFREHGKGFVVVDLSHDRPELERVKIKMPREFYQEVIDYNKFSQRIHLLKEKIQSLDKQAMLDLTVVGGDFNSADVYELIQEAIGEDVLNLRPNFKPDKVLEEERIIDENKILDPRALLQKKLNERYGRDEINKLSIDLLDNLSVGRVDDAKIISNRFYSEHYYNGENLSNNLNYSEDYYNGENLSNNLNYSEDYYNGENLSNNLNYSEDYYNGENLSNNLNDSTKEYKLNIEDKSSEKDSNNDKLKNKEISLDDFQ